MDAPFFVSAAAGLCALMAAAWAVQRLTKSSGWVDAIWSLGVGLGGVAAALASHPDSDMTRRLVVGGLVAVWSLRLGLHIAKRTHGGDDDPRYAALVEQWGNRASLYLFVFLQIQALCALVLVAAVRFAAINPQPFPGFGDIAGIGLLILAIAGESLADAQLAAFSRAHKGGVCDAGLWKWSRHPNYFFEWLGWCAWALIAVDLAQPWTWVALGAPALMYYLLVYASGIPPLEAHMLRTRGEAFRAYQARTNAFFPGPNHSQKGRMS